MITCTVHINLLQCPHKIYSRPWSHSHHLFYNGLNPHASPRSEWLCLDSIIHLLHVALLSRAEEAVPERRCDKIHCLWIGHSFVPLRRLDHGVFAVWASLPGTTRVHATTSEYRDYRSRTGALPPCASLWLSLRPSRTGSSLLRFGPLVRPGLSPRSIHLP